MRLRAIVLGVALLGGLNAAAWAQIKIGQTAGFTGAVAAGVKEVTDGAKLYLDAVNAQGGVAGQKIELVSLDDKFDPKLSAPNAKQLIDQGVLALFLTRGTPQSQAILPLLAEHKLALIAPSTGAMLLHRPVNPFVFNVRATYQREAERAVQHLAGMGVTRIGLVQVDDSFGDDGATGALKGLQTARLQPTVHLKYARAKPELAPLMKQVAQADVQALVFIGAAEPTADGVEALRAAGSNAQLVTLSNNASSGFIKALKGQARGVIVSQVFPSERSLNTPLVREAQGLAKARGTELTPQNLEGFAAAKVLVEGLKKAAKDKDLSRGGLLRALDNLGKFDIGGLEVNFNPGDHTGLDYADVSIIGPDGKFWR
ncbi:ABC transporter substrate-binding protein [Roseateles sp. DAIF2]|uniref:ABC transporter substrate-binding protein n=1 Tax=Roseateles sp. DAIF2 TaxID=2714952 RepID=UPI0018A31656|nr:ABC transporter substrate-binding protein [Roseateles sp. DAIF2]QPF73518.1 ABC transporter substrate-binding protein [Roseateles sp. DAIF2]